jgi:hypothetical protein
MKTRLVYLALIVVMGLAIPVSAGLSDEVKMTVDVILESEDELVFGALDLTPEQKEAFMPMWREYQAELDVVMANRINLIKSFMESRDSLTEERAEEMIRQFFAHGEKRNELRAGWAKRFQEVLPATKVVRLIQIENKIQSLVELKLAESIPLAS